MNYVFIYELCLCIFTTINQSCLGSDPLMRQLYELDTPNYDRANIDPMYPALWRYRTRVSVEHLNHKFQEYLGGHAGSSGREILKVFLQRVKSLYPVSETCACAYFLR